MKTHLKMMFLLAVLTEVLMTSGESFVGTVGGEVKITCPYPDEHKYTGKYICRDPCKALISSETADQFITSGRYSLYNSLQSRTFTVIIKNLRLTDSGVYYCGLDNWFKDIRKKVYLSVQPASPVNRPSHTTPNTIIRSNTDTTTMTSAVADDPQYQTRLEHDPSENVIPHEQSLSVEPREPTSMVKTSVTVVFAGVLVVLVFCVLVASAFFCSKRSDLKSRSLQPSVTEQPVQDLPNPNQTADGVHNIYDEIIDYSTYSTVQQCEPASQDEESILYSLITHHTG